MKGALLPLWFVLILVGKDTPPTTAFPNNGFRPPRLQHLEDFSHQQMKLKRSAIPCRKSGDGGDGTKRRIDSSIPSGPKWFDGQPKASTKPFKYPKYRPIPVMPSRLFQELALSQLEFLASALVSTQRPGSSKVKTMALYLPQENVITGHLEFTPAILYPNSDRIFIAPEADSGVAPTLPTALTKLPGFSHAKALMPAYPMVSSSDTSRGRIDATDGSSAYGNVGIVEEVLCGLQGRGACALSVPLFSGVQTVGVLLVSPADVPEKPLESVWTELDKRQVARAARSLSLALSMDQENQEVADQNKQIAQDLSDTMHQVKNPLQALRTYGKLLQRQIAYDETDGVSSVAFQNSASSKTRLSELADHLMVQSDRLARRLHPVDSMVERLASSTRRPSFLLPAPETVDKTTSNTGALAPSSSLARWPTPLVPWDYQNPNEIWANTDSVIVPRTRNENDSMFNEREKPISDSKRHQQKAFFRSDGYSGSKVPLEMAFVGDVLEPVFSAFSAIAEDRGISFTVQDESDELPGVLVHPESLQEVVSNILDNAFKYGALGRGTSTNPSSTAQVRVCLLPNNSVHKEEAAGVTILVTDNGPGIPKDDADSGLVFQRSYRAPATQERAKGQGLGLSIAHNLVQAMGGKLRAVVADDDAGRAQLGRENNFNLLDGATLEIVLYRNQGSK